ncbi:hypothetical protein Aperf_G00000074568 [Anoplocephala perfoliata]
MGVHDLWTILTKDKPVELPLRSLGGKKIAIDLSGWICSDINAQTSCELYLRNLVFRLIALLRDDILPIVVTDGTAPAIKVLAMQKRLQLSGLDNSNEESKPVSRERTQLSETSSRCAQLLRALGVPCIASPGEAEAMCAFLNMENLVDGCITNDSDAFLYGATVVYRHFSLKNRNASAEAYFSEHIGLGRQSLVFLSLLLGCDYWPFGVHGIGRVSALRILAQVDVEEALDRLCRSSATSPDSDDDVDEIWSSPTWRKITEGLAECPVTQIVDEFLKPWQERGWQMPSSEHLVWTRPNIRQAISFCLNFHVFEPLYALAKFIPLLALWIIRSPNAESFAEIMEPLRIIKKRVVSRVPCYEVEWSRSSDDIWSSQLLVPGSSFGKKLKTSLRGFFTNSGYRFTVPIAEFRSAFPQLADTFDVNSLPNFTAKRGIQKKNAKRQIKKPKAKKAVRMKKAIDSLDPNHQLNREDEASEIPIQTVSSWDSPSERLSPKANPKEKICHSELKAFAI